MKKDEFVSTVSKLTLYVEEHWKAFTYGLGALAAIILLVFISVVYMQHREEKLKQTLNRGMEYFRTPIAGESDQTVASIGPSFETEKEKLEEALKIFQELIDDAPRSKVAPLALYYSGLSHFQLEMYEDAARDLEKFLEQAEETLLRDVARSSLAQAYFKQKNYEASAKVWSELAEDQTALYPRAEALLHLAEAKSALGNTEEALEIYRKIIDEFPGTVAAMEASNIIS
jgi:TolA-binding protein